MLQYIDWNPINMEQLYVSPGMVDFNIRRNREWESRETLTKAAVSGGVTLCVEERTLEESDRPEFGPLYCDLGYTAIMDPSLVLSVKLENHPDALGLKGYMTPQSDTIGALHDLRHWFETSNRFGLPLLLDPAFLEDKVLYLASPCRLLPLQQRIAAQEFSEVFGGAFAEEDLVEGNSEEEGEDSSDKKDSKRAERSFTSPKVSLRRVNSRQITIGHPSGEVSGKNIHSALEEKIKEDVGKMETLVSAEVAAYRGMGRTVFRGALTRSQSLSDATTTGPKAKKRPGALQMISEKPHTDATSVYLNQLTLYPHTMELKGVKRIIRALKEAPCRVHITNLCSANAIAYIRKSKEEDKVQLTCETCPHFLYFTDQSIHEGDTRLKNFPPIRNKSNCNFLWELVTMNTVEAVCSQHVPIPAELKFKPNFRKAMPGICGLGCTLQALWTLLKRPFTDMSTFEHYLVRMAKWTAANPAKIMGLPTRGAIKKGFFADLIIWDPFETVNLEQTHSQQTAQCPYLGEPLYGRVKKVLVRGRLAYDEGSFYPVGRPVGRS